MKLHSPLLIQGLVALLGSVLANSVHYSELEILEVHFGESREALESRCMSEKGLDVHHLLLAENSQLEKYSFSECLDFCLKNDQTTNFTHMMIGYHDGTFYDKFKCLCGSKEAIQDDIHGEFCDERCPNSRHKCGNANNHVLSVYCLYHSCATEEPICQQRLPHDTHGCVMSSQINWQKAHNVRNFSGNTNDHTACVWECHDNHPYSMYSLTRVVGGILTCSCGYPDAFRPDRMILTSFCPSGGVEENDLYMVNCVGDIKPDGEEEEEIEYGSKCHDILPIGCIYEELLNENKSQGISLHLDGSSSFHPHLCHKLCQSTSTRFLHVGIRVDSSRNNSLECTCLERGAFGQALLGPNVACDHDCGLGGTGFTCGGPRLPKLDETPASVSLYCLRLPLDEEHLGSNGSCPTNSWNQSLPLLQKIRGSVLQEIKTLDLIVVGLVIFIVIIAGFLGYLVYSRGCCPASE